MSTDTGTVVSVRVQGEVGIPTAAVGINYVPGTVVGVGILSYTLCIPRRFSWGVVVVV